MYMFLMICLKKNNCSGKNGSNADQMLRKNGATWRGGDQLYYLVVHTLDEILDTITESNGSLYDISLYRER